jgi:hypothetical protein
MNSGVLYKYDYTQTAMLFAQVLKALYETWSKDRDQLHNKRGFLVRWPTV